MREVIGLVIGLYLTVAMVVGGAGAYAFLTKTTKVSYDCTAAQGAPNWVPYVVVRGLIWPWNYYQEQKDTKSIPDWLMVKYDPFPTACGRGAVTR